MDAATTTVTPLQGDTLDQICLRHLGTTGNGTVEHILSINPGLAALGPILPLGTPITIPAAAPAPAQPSPLQLWT